MPLIKSLRTCLATTTRPGNHHWHVDAALVNKLLVPVKLVTVIAKTKNQRVVVKPVALEPGDDLPDLLVGLQQTIVVVSDLLPHERDVRIIRRHRHLGAVDHLGRAPAQLPPAELHLPKEWLAFFASLPALTGRPMPPAPRPRFLGRKSYIARVSCLKL